MKAGDKVTIYNTTISGKRIIEGEAILVKKTTDLGEVENWLVRFPGESSLVNRLVEKPAPA